MVKYRKLGKKERLKKGDQLLSWSHPGEWESIETSIIGVIVGDNSCRRPIKEHPKHRNGYWAKKFKEPAKSGTFKYKVSVVRTSSRFATIHVVAKTQLDARRKALDEAGGINFPSEQDADYTISSCIRED